MADVDDKPENFWRDILKEMNGLWAETCKARKQAKDIISKLNQKLQEGQISPLTYDIEMVSILRLCQRIDSTQLRLQEQRAATLEKLRHFK